MVCHVLAASHDEFQSEVIAPTAVITRTSYHLNISEDQDNVPPGYLFLCPLAELQSDVPPSFQIPHCPAYWSLDPLGVEHLSAHEAKDLGFPTIRVEMRLGGYYWSGSVYAGLRQFHHVKGFEPDSEDLARHLGYPLCEVSSELDSPFALGKLSRHILGHF
jgi:hypothetical protein